MHDSEIDTDKSKYRTPIQRHKNEPSCVFVDDWEISVLIIGEDRVRGCPIIYLWGVNLITIVGSRAPVQTFGTFLPVTNHPLWTWTSLSVLVLFSYATYTRLGLHCVLRIDPRLRTSIAALDWYSSYIWDGYRVWIMRSGRTCGRPWIDLQGTLRSFPLKL